MNKGLIAFAFILAFLMVIPSSATQNEGLNWNYGDGARYNYNATLYQGNSSTLEVAHEWTYYVIAPQHYELGNLLNAIQALPATYAITFGQNGTERQGVSNTTFAVPVDNWSLLSTIIASLPDHTSVQYLNTSDTWGYEVTYPTDNSTNTYQWIFSKSTGVLESMRYEVTNHYFHDVIVIERFASTPDTILLDAVVAVGAGMFIALVSYDWKEKIFPARTSRQPDVSNPVGDWDISEYT